MNDVMISTTHEIPGHRVTDFYGEVFGLTVRSRNMFSDIGAGFKSLVGGEVKGYTKLLRSTRQEALDRLRQQATEVGANAVVMMRFEGNDISSNMTEIVAYGTAVRVTRE